ncbi:hypothetical protein [Sulfurimonas sp.]|uniref:hypothetical protein n=1 Tax=Sulfurimonas sp. TaxID=2022749 RepID=UPI00356367E9
MSDGLSKLRSIGAQKIHEQTHIARQHVQAVLHETFDGMTKIQLLGFISILEREYSVDLSDLKAKVQEFFNVPSIEDEQDTKVFVSPKKKKNYTIIYIAVVILIFAVAVLYTLDFAPGTSSQVKPHTIDNSAINNAKDSMSHNATIEDKNVTTPLIIEPKPEPVKVVKSFKIIPSSELWIGYIDLSTYEKYQKLFTGELEIDPNKDWILTLGHGYVKVEINGEVTEFKDKLNIRLLYKDSKISKISFSEFKELNRGNKW